MINLWRKYRRSLLNEHKYLLLIFLLGTCQCKKENPADAVVFPDPKFQAALLESGVDADGDGQISTEEAGSIRALSLGPSGISDLTGIEAFVNLDSLAVKVNPLAPPDLSSNKALQHLGLSGCGLKELDITKNSALRSLDCTGNTGLNSYLKTLDLSGNPELEELIVPGNELTELKLSANPKLQKLECSRNRLPELDLTQNLLLTELKCKNNLLKSLDVGVNTELTLMVSCGNQLSSINLSQNTKLKLIGIDNMPGMDEVCVWTLPFPPEGVRVLMGYSPNVYFTTECSN